MFSAGLLMLALEGPMKTLLALRPIAFLGRISFGLYVYHPLAMTFARQALPAASWMTLFLASLAFTIALSTASYYLLETPFLRLKRRLSATRPTQALPRPACPRMPP